MQMEYDRLFIGGAWTTPLGRDRIEVTSPFSEEVIGAVPAGTCADMDAAVRTARTTFEAGEWSSSGLDSRVAILHRLRDAIAAEREDLAALVTAEMGSPIAQSLSIQIGAPLGILDAFIRIAGAYSFEEVRLGDVGNSLVTREPVGVVAAVVPWNVPLTVSMVKLAPALLAGCTVVLKPAPETPLSSFRLARLFADAGLPNGVLSVVPADRAVSEYLVGHPGIDKVAFTGSTGAGRKIASICGEQLKRFTLELGGKSAAIILDDADFTHTVESLRLGSFRNSGQICSLKTRLLVPRHRHDEFVDRLFELVQSMPVGDPLNMATEIGPLVSARQREMVRNYIALGKQEGAVVVAGGVGSCQSHGWFVEPTIFVNVKPDMRIAQEEIFGPVVSVISYDNEEEAVAIANNSCYGLNGSVFTRDIDHGLAVARRIRTGAVEINGSPVGFQSPIGGYKGSGIGREAGREGLESFFEVQSKGIPRQFAEELATRLADAAG